ncbi:MAG: folylpolyglutamate synthase [Faecalibacterium sp.]|jgi:dihydrofolate synthase/folylpolyglutamate synthase|nr:folylpolyglutamate synthase [Faecalibacterium sp.]
MDLTKANAWFSACPAEGENVAAAFSALGCAEMPVQYVAVAGTAGKTAVASMEAAILEAAGLPCGLYLTGNEPLRERIRIAGEPAPAKAFTAAAQKLAACSEVFPRAAAELAAACFCFSAAKCAFAVVELEDALLAEHLPALPACAVTQIGEDGSGHSLERIACMASAVMRKGTAAVTTPAQPKAALTEIIVAAGKADCALTVPDGEDLTQHKARRLENHFDYGGYELVLPTVGRPAAESAAVAVELALALWRKGYEISDEAILKGLAAVQAESGAHLLRRRPYVLADPCHKPMQAAALAQLLCAAEFDHVSVIAGLSGCEKPDAFFAALENGFIPEAEKTEKNQLPGMSDNAIDHVYLVTPEGPDAVKAEDAAAAARFHFDTTVCADLEEAVEKARADGNEGILILGGKAVCRAAKKHFPPRG